MIRILVHWLISALSFVIVSWLVSGIEVNTFAAALMAALVYGVLSVTLGLFLKIISLPLIFLTLGLFWLVINAVILMLAGAFVPGFRVKGFVPAFIGAIALSVVQWLLRWLVAY